MHMTEASSSAAQVMQRCDLLGTISEEPQHLTRRFATPAMRQVNEQVTDWMQAAGMHTWLDPIGNLVGRYPASTGQAKTLLLGSHLDTIRDAGRYDGILGVLVALACVERLHSQQQKLPFAIEVLAFADEEGLRYHSTYLGSRVVAGTFDHTLLSLVDAAGISLEQAIRDFGCDPEGIPLARRDRHEVLGYCEVHIEQGPVLEARQVPVCAVSAITGMYRVSIGFTGMAGHAGTVPMDLRRDALAAAAEFSLATETLAQTTPGLVATIGQLEVQPGASNVIPGHVTLTLDLRHQEDAIREQAHEQIQLKAREICQRRNITLDWQIKQANKTVFCSPNLTLHLVDAMRDLNYETGPLASGAGHDAASMAELTDIAMLFVRCKGGISHHPAESVRVEDVTVAIEVLERFLTRLARQVEEE